MPGGVSPELAWSYMKFSRQSKLISAPLKSIDDLNFGYWLPDYFLKDISYIDRHASGEILVADAGVHKVEQKKYLVNSLMEEAIASSLLEGAATTRKKAKELLRSGRKPKGKAESMVFNNYKTILKIKDLINEDLDEKLLLALHKSITVNTMMNPDECGRFRTDSDDPICVHDAEGQEIYEPPPPERISKMIKILFEYANEKNDKVYTHPIIKAINLHFYLSYIHPFMDGNGRTARALFYWYMLKNGYWMFEYLTISKVFLAAPAQYARAFLYTEIDDLDLTYFISFHLKVINTAIEELIKHIKDKQRSAQDSAKYLIKFPGLNSRQEELLKSAFDNPGRRYTIAYHRRVHDVTYESARRDFVELCQRELFIKSKKGREFIFVINKSVVGSISEY